MSLKYKITFWHQLFDCIERNGDISEECLVVRNTLKTYFFHLHQLSEVQVPWSLQNKSVSIDYIIPCSPECVFKIPWGVGRCQGWLVDERADGDERESSSFRGSYVWRNLPNRKSVSEWNRKSLAVLWIANRGYSVPKLLGWESENG